MPPLANPEISSLQAPDEALQLAALLDGAGLSSIDSVGWIRVTGEDRVRWLNGMVTNSVQDLQPGHGCYNFLLSVQGRIQGDGYIFAEPDALLLETASEHISGLMSLLDRFIIMDDVELAENSAGRSGLSISGPKATALLENIGFSAASLGELEFQATVWNSSNVTIIHAYSPLVPRFEIWTEPETAEALYRALLSAGAVICDPQSQEWLRLLEGTPRYGTDIRERELPQETGQARALHFSKGCYLGQEIVERIRSRGNVHRAFTAFRLAGAVPSPSTLLEAEDKQVGELTSAAAIPLPTGTVQLGLGYVRREALERNLRLQYPGGTAIPIPRPFNTVEATKSPSASESSERV
ncbi:MULTISPECIES: folate-binding protein YgfZ [Acidobacteriaceae]|uniref:CAF17-like 4Fe-4S cluster assembly/insertion protein YgfZ n=1 Tax=Acidobacteriaceae TaxID=204434 RepID=UPI00131EA8F9|nr:MULTISPECIES: folate-binding protein [Acidobacteriaceae]MDW5264936.1 folate-binding protein [Edaphobacter sp.]